MSDGRRTRITVIEDDPDFRDMLRAALETDHDVAAHSGQGLVVQEVATERPDLLIVDLHLDRDDLQGPEIVSLVRSHRSLRRTPIIICSADLRGLRGMIDALLEAGNTAVLPKPFGLDELETTVRQGLGGGFPAAQLTDGADGYADLLAGSTDPVLVTDHQGRYVDANEPALALLGMTLDRLRALAVSDVVATGRAWTDAEWQRFQRDGWWHGSVTLKLADARTQRMLATARTVAGEAGPWFVSWLRPIDEVVLAS